VNAADIGFDYLLRSSERVVSPKSGLQFRVPLLCGFFRGPVTDTLFSADRMVLILFFVVVTVVWF